MWPRTQALSHGGKSCDIGGEAVCMHMRPSRNHNNFNRNDMNIDIADVKTVGE